MSASAKSHPHEKPHHPHWPLAILLFTFVFGLGLLSVHEPGTWLHIKTGAKILETGEIPRVDPFSYTVAGRPWTTDSWLADAAFYVVHSRLGPAGLRVLKALVAAAAFALLLPLNAASPLTAAGVLGFGAFSAWTGFTETPAVFDLLLVSLMIRLLRPRRHFLWSLPAQVLGLELLWSNLHGTTAVLGLWLAGLKVFKASLRTTDRERLPYLAVLAAALLGLRMNPHGFGVVAHLFDGYQPSGDFWQAYASWSSLYGLFAALGAAGCVVCLQQEFFLSIGSASVLALSLIFPVLRPLAILAVCPVVALALGHFLLPVDDSPSRVARLGLAFAGLLVLHTLSVAVPLAPYRGYGAVSLRGALNFLDANGVRGRLFNDPEAGSLIIGGSDRPVFVDGRRGLYGAAFMRDVDSWAPRFRQLSEVYGFDYAVLLNRRGAYPARALDEDPQWRLAYADDEALVYLRRGGADGWLIQNFPPSAVTPNRLWPDGLDPALRQARRLPRLLEDLDRWIVQSPDGVQALLWKAYVLERLKLGPKAERLRALALERPRLARDPELMALLGFVDEKGGRTASAVKLYLRAASIAARRLDRPLEAALLARLGPIYRTQGDPARASELERRAAELSAAAPE